MHLHISRSSIGSKFLALRAHGVSRATSQLEDFFRLANIVASVMQKKIALNIKFFL
jgi:hypothetical protein